MMSGTRLNRKNAAQLAFVATLLGAVLACSASPSKTDVSAPALTQPSGQALTSLVKYEGIKGQRIADDVRTLAEAATAQSGKLVTAEVLLPVDDRQPLTIDPGRKSLIEWLTLLQHEIRGLTWTVAPDAIHIKVDQGINYPNPLDERLSTGLVGTKTLSQWQTWIGTRYQKNSFYFDDWHYDAWYGTNPSYDACITKPVTLSVKSGTTLRQLFDALAIAFGGRTWTAELADVAHLPRYPIKTLNRVSFADAIAPNSRNFATSR